MVRLGDLDINNTIRDNATPIDVPIKEIIAHPKYTPAPSIANDIALIRLKNTVQFTGRLESISYEREYH